MNSMSNIWHAKILDLYQKSQKKNVSKRYETYSMKRGPLGAVNQQFVLFSQCFLSYQDRIIFLATLNFSLAFNLVKANNFVVW